MNKKQFEKENPELKSEMMMEEAIASSELAENKKDIKELTYTTDGLHYYIDGRSVYKEEFDEESSRQKLLKKIIAKAKQEERDKIIKIIKDMPEEFPEIESDLYDLAHKDAKQYLLDKIN